MQSLFDNERIDFYMDHKKNFLFCLKPALAGILFAIMLSSANSQTEIKNKPNFSIALVRTGVSYLWRGTGIKLGVEKNRFAFNGFGGLSYSGGKCAGVQLDYRIGNMKSKILPYLSGQFYYDYRPMNWLPFYPQPYTNVKNFSGGLIVGFQFMVTSRIRMALGTGLFRTRNYSDSPTGPMFVQNVLSTGLFLEAACYLRPEKREFLPQNETEYLIPQSKRKISLVVNALPFFQVHYSPELSMEVRGEIDIKKNMMGMVSVSSLFYEGIQLSDPRVFGVYAGPGYRFFPGKKLALIFWSRFGYSTDFGYYGYQLVKSGYFAIGISEHLRYNFHKRLFAEAGVGITGYLNGFNKGFNYSQGYSFAGLGVSLSK